jgi:hypothetical protein
MSQKQPNRFNPYSEDPDRVDPDAKTRRIENPQGGMSSRGAPPEREGGDDWRSMVSPQDKDWRSSRRGERPARATGPMAAMPDGFLVWMSRGGWRFVLGAGVAAVALLIFFLLSGGPSDKGPTTPTTRAQPTAPARTRPPTAAIIVDDNPPGTLPTTTPEVAPSGGERLTVAGTGSEGLFMRDAPQGNLVMTLPEGSVVEVAGPDQEAGGLIWKHIREPGGAEGWSSADYLQPAQ